MTAQIIGPEVDIVADEEFATSQVLSESEVATYELLHAGPVAFEVQRILGNAADPSIGAQFTPSTSTIRSRTRTPLCLRGWDDLRASSCPRGWADGLSLAAVVLRRGWADLGSPYEAVIPA
jgi:hypothetical protein